MIKPTVFLEYKNKLYYDEKNILCSVLICSCQTMNDNVIDV